MKKFKQYLENMDPMLAGAMDKVRNTRNNMQGAAIKKQELSKKYGLPMQTIEDIWNQGYIDGYNSRN